ncbi:MAG TPA: 50S ribosomal protein L9 [Acidimicrobiia bacterium]|nr:50S ribosomal protein L9 [Acidimicrobiia bacterium]
MKVVLRDDLDNLGKKGDIVDVADGYARNYLVPRGLAIVATKGAVKQAESMQRARAAKDAREREGAEALAARLAAAPVTIPARAGEGGKLFGSVTATDVAAAVESQLGVELDRRKLELEPLRELGPHTVTVRIHPEVEATFDVVVVVQE